MSYCEVSNLAMHRICQEQMIRELQLAAVLDAFHVFEGRIADLPLKPFEKDLIIGMIREEICRRETLYWMEREES